MTAHTFQRKQRIRCKNEFTDLIRNGRRYKGQNVIFFTKPSQTAVSRLGISIGRKYGNAVKRNRFKRLVRESFRTAPPFHHKTDLVAVPAFSRQPATLAHCRADLAACAAGLQEAGK